MWGVVNREHRAVPTAQNLAEHNVIGGGAKQTDIFISGLCKRSDQLFDGRSVVNANADPACIAINGTNLNHRHAGVTYHLRTAADVINIELNDRRRVVGEHLRKRVFFTLPPLPGLDKHHAIALRREYGLQRFGDGQKTRGGKSRHHAHHQAGVSRGQAAGLQVGYIAQLAHRCFNTGAQFRIHFLRHT